MMRLTPLVFTDSPDSNKKIPVTIVGHGDLAIV